MIYLTDANVLSEAMKSAPNAGVIKWLQQHESEIAVDSIILGEIQFGILRLPKGKRRQRLERWFEEGIRKIFCFAWEVETARHWAKLLAALRKSGHSMPIKDSMSAATALHHGLTIVTHNKRDFENTGVSMLDPFAS